jgi:CRISPR-associated endonuclease/helicase Cas3
MPVETDFRTLTGFIPLSWQKRLYHEHFASGEVPLGVDVPTGLGKTSVMALWLIARANGARLPRRLVYVVDRRAVVDQATDEAEKLREALEGKAKHFDAFDAAARSQAKKAAAELKERVGLRGRKLPISTLRGAHVDNREWLDDPAAPAIVVGTVDMIGSRLLFEGYGVSAKMRPYQAGLLGVDALIVLDEAHLVPPFTHLLRSIERDTSLWPQAEADRDRLPRFAVLPLSATQRDSGEDLEERPPFRLDDGDASDKTVAQRLSAPKGLRLIRFAEDPDKQLAQAAWALATGDGKPARVVIFCDRRDKQDNTGGGPSAQGVKGEIEGLARADRRSGRPKTDIHEPELLVGARRIWEREEVARRLRDLGFIGGDGLPDKPAFLIATAAGEVGVDIDADHMVSDLVAWERMVQRLGRVNRRGTGNAEVAVLWSEPSVKNADARTESEQRALTAFASKAVIESLPFVEGAFDASPGALRRLAEGARQDGDLKSRIDKATTDEPLRPALSRALVDAWSMTSLKEHTGRPEVAPWLRGWVEEVPQTTVVWRMHIPVRINSQGRTALPSKAEIEDFFEAAPPHESEKLETETHRVASWLEQRAAALLKSKPQAAQAVDEEGVADAEIANSDARELEIEQSSLAAAKLERGDIAALLLSPGGAFAGHYTLGELTQGSKGKDKKDLQEALAGKIIVVKARLAGLKDGLLSPGSGDPVETADALPDWSMQAGLRVRQAESRSEGEEAEWRFEDDFALRRNNEGIVQEWLVVEHFKDTAQSEDARAISRPQELAAHQDWARREMVRIAERVGGLPGEAVRALALGAFLHDEGKKAARWQRAFQAARDAEKFKLTLPLAKTRGPIDQAVLGRYRHEFGSLIALEEDAELKKQPEDWRDLVLHLVAAHHGGARPTIDTRGCEAGPPSQLEERARAVALRFARLQRRWGPWGLAWWEALLRAADQQASRDNDAADPAGDGGTPRRATSAPATTEG